MQGKINCRIGSNEHITVSGIGECTIKLNWYKKCSEAMVNAPHWSNVMIWIWLINHHPATMDRAVCFVEISAWDRASSHIGQYLAYYPHQPLPRVEGWSTLSAEFWLTTWNLRRTCSLHEYDPRCFHYSAAV